jgi:hypothetical protein
MERSQMPNRPIDIKHAEQDPAEVFLSPEEVLQHESLSHDEKVRILRRWRLDALNLEVATEENMPGGNGSMLESITKALMELEGEEEGDAKSPTKYGF